MLKPDEIVDLIKNHDKTDEIIKTISDDFEYYNSLLMDGEITVSSKKIKTRTTFLGLAALYANNELIKGLLKEGVPADGLDLFLYRISLNEDSNYRILNQGANKGMYINKDIRCWSTMTEIFNSCDEFILSIPWSTPVILAILSENSEGLKLLIEHGATCDLRYPYFANALSICEDEDVMNVLLKDPGTHMRETRANILIIFNLPLAKYLYKLGIKPDENIISKIIERDNISSNAFFGSEYEINSSSKLWEDYYQKRAEACIEFYKSKGYSEYKNKSITYW